MPTFNKRRTKPSARPVLQDGNERPKDAIREHSRMTPGLPQSILLVAIALGLGLRASAVLRYDFPLNDGGLFFSMVEDILHNGFSTPPYASYNAASIPFVYPPLALYLAAALAKLGIPLLQVFRFLPFLSSAASIPASYLLGCQILADRRAGAFASLAVAILPESFYWRIMGGGVTRSLGFLFGLLTLVALGNLLRVRSKKAIVLTCLFGSATVLSHPEASLYFGVGALVLLAFQLRTRETASAVLVAGMTILLLTAMWWLPALRAHGLGPFIAGTGSGDLFPAYLLIYSMLSKLDPLTLAFVLLGILSGARRTIALLAVWAAAMFLILPRGANQFAIVVLAMLFGLGAKAVTEAILLPLDGQSKEELAGPHLLRRSRLAFIVLLAVMFVPNWTATLTSPILGAVSPPEQAAMRWASENTDADAVFLVVEGRDFFAARDAEWFPALTGRVSAAAVQGYEWLSGVDFAQRIVAFRELQRCRGADSTCFADWASRHDAPFNYLYLLKRPQVQEAATSCCRALLEELDSAPAYEVVYQNVDVTIYKRRP